MNQKEEKTALPSFVQRALESESLSDDERYALKFCSAAMYGGGLDTVSSNTFDSKKESFLSTPLTLLIFLDDGLDENFFPYDDHPPRNSA